MAMREFVYLLLCLSCACFGRRMQSLYFERRTLNKSEHEAPAWLLRGRARRTLNTMQALATLFFISNPPAAFQTHLPEGRSAAVSLARHVVPTANRLMARRANMRGIKMRDVSKLDRPEMDIDEPLDSGATLPKKRLFYTARSRESGVGRREFEDLANVSVPHSVTLSPGLEESWLEENRLTDSAQLASRLERVARIFPQFIVEDLGRSLSDYESSERDQQASIEEASSQEWPEEFTLKQYNVLAGVLGDNTKPWMLQGANVSFEQREAVWQKFDNHDRTWREELTQDQWKLVNLWHDEVFDWETRKDLLVEEMFSGSPDILTLQEMDEYVDFFRPEFQSRKYDQVYAQRIGKKDGVAIAFNRERFRLLEKGERFYLPDENRSVPLHLPGTNFAVSADVRKLVLEKASNLHYKGGYGEWGGRIAIFALLQDKLFPERKIMIGTCHLDKNPEDPAKSLSRFNQMSVLNVIQGHLAKKWNVSVERDMILFAGDLNTDLNEETMVKQPALAGVDYRQTQMSIRPGKDSCTTLTEERKLWIDYIFHAGQVEVTNTTFPMCADKTMPNADQPSDHFPVVAKFRWKSADSNNFGSIFVIPEGYNFSQSTEENYRAKDDTEPLLVGEFTDIRKNLDYSYHGIYQQERQLLQDRIVKEFLHTQVFDVEATVTCEAPRQNWIVFTAGGMGAGKSYTMEWLSFNNYFPLEAFVYVDPDRIRSMLPEADTYSELDGATFGYLTQKEAGYMSEILAEIALGQKKNIVFDGSLRNHEWHLQYFRDLRRRNPGLKIAIIYVRASLKTEYERAVKRAKATGRVIPDAVMEETSREIPHSLDVLVPQVDFFATIDTETAVPCLVSPEGMIWDDFKQVWSSAMTCDVD